MYSTTPASLHSITTDSIRLQPIGVTAGTLVAYSTLVMQRRVDIFGPDVSEFKPERWDSWSPKPWQYIPFNGGPRTCIGQQFALTEMGYILCRYVAFKRCEWSS